MFLNTLNDKGKLLLGQIIQKVSQSCHPCSHYMLSHKIHVPFKVSFKYFKGLQSYTVNKKIVYGWMDEQTDNYLIMPY